MNSQSNIHILPMEVVNQIAAGEVLERPSFLVKELVENSLDAKATEIEVDFSSGGRSLSVRDNGIGMSIAELPLALHPHATSKILVGEDIFALTSFGFRGEALASAAAVSKMFVTSKPAMGAEGAQIRSHFGKTQEPVPISSAVGTRVEVSELFENIPARLKFLKSESAESGHIKNTLKALALSRADVNFRVLQDSELKFYWPAQKSLRLRAQEILGLETLYEGFFQEGSLKIEVCVSSPMQTAQSGRNIWLFVQDRWVQDRSIVAAIQEAYRNLLMHGEYPQVVVKISCDPMAVDVNVHPSKSQVKFRDSQSIFRGVVKAIRQVLETSPWLTKGEIPISRDHSLQWSPPAAELVSLETTSLRMSEPQLERIQYPQHTFTAGVTASAPQVAESVSSFQWAQLQVIGQVHMTYIVAQSSDAFYLIDQHAAHERVMFERLMAQFKAGHFDVQNYLLPLVVDLTAHETESLVAARTQVERLGIFFEQMGPECIAIHGTPSFVSEIAAIEAVKKFAHELCEDSASFALEKKVGDIVASMACHSAVRAGQTMGNEQAKQLLLQMDEHPLSSFCPHGRPVYVRKSFHEVEREFGRIV